MGSSQSSTNQEEGIRTENGGALSTGEKAAVAAGAVAGLAAVAWGVAELVSGATSTSGEQRKTMKAPGKDERIYRDDFERDPASHFRSLRNK
ncbi:hypothetical protein M0R45_025472 [Rubus argutus]|uniref:Uncharacterized protein n=1 Tax=Rubus argutus TaxID=59490 RepID=A0AAW1WU95_RUBAR